MGSSIDTVIGLLNFRSKLMLNPPIIYMNILTSLQYGRDVWRMEPSAIKLLLIFDVWLHMMEIQIVVREVVFFKIITRNTMLLIIEMFLSSFVL